MSQQSPRSFHIRQYPEPALDLIDPVGPGGEFMSQDVTAKRCRAEIWNPTLMDRQPRGAREWLTLFTPVTSRQELR
jgi:hypothetical protein